MLLVPYMGAELTLVYLLFVLRHNGSLAVHEHPDGGVVTSLRLPAGS
jgi:signal transduction histidine kinase